MRAAPLSGWRLARLGCLWASLACAGAAGAYSVDSGDLLVRPVVGASVNVLRLDVATRGTPPAGLLTGVDVDFGVQGPFGLTAGLRPVVAPGFVDVGALIGGKYRWVGLEAPLLPYLGAALTGAMGAPLRSGELHWNLGARLAAGMDYFVLRDLAVGLEWGNEVSWLLAPLGAVEWSQEVLLGLSWRY